MEALHAFRRWADAIGQEVLQLGFAKTFTRHVRELADESHRHPVELADQLRTWLLADPRMAPFVDRAAPPPTPAETRPRFHPAARRDRVPDAPIPGVVERDGTPVKVYHREHFANWGGTVCNAPALTFVPRTRRGVLTVVRFARRHALRVRVAGARHSWTSVYANSGDVLISMMELDAATAPHKLAMPADNPADNELERISFEGSRKTPDGRSVAFVRLGAAATSDHFRRWALSRRGGDWEWMIPALPILVSITSAGWTQTMCHGAGISHGTVSDFCVEVELVNCRGHLQTIKDRNQLRAVSGCFGMLGVIVSQVFVMDPLMLAKFHPRKIPTPLAIPPVARHHVPANDDFDVSDFSDDDLEKARQSFERDCFRYYSEWFWFPFQRECWVNCWDTAPLTGSERPRYPDKGQVRSQNMQAALARIFEVTAMRLLPPRWQAELMGFAAMALLPEGPCTTNVPDALHFRRGIHRMPVRDCEIEIEIPARADGRPDLSIVQRAWWMGIEAVYDSLPDAPMRTTLEMRIVGPSDVTLSTQRHNEWGTCSIEVLTNTLVDDYEWANFIDGLTARWASLRDPRTRRLLRVKPHFAKEWPRQIRDTPILQYLSEVNRDDIDEFKQQLAAASADGGYFLGEAFQAFGNDTILEIIGERRSSNFAPPLG